MKKAYRHTGTKGQWGEGKDRRSFPSLPPRRISDRMTESHTATVRLDRMALPVLTAWVLGGLVILGGCAQPEPMVERVEQGPRVSVAPAYQAEADRIQDGPEDYIRAQFDRCDGLQKYRCRFFRQERLGLIPKLTPLEEMWVWFRKEPFSVKFEWIEPERYDGQYFESVYVEGENEDKVVVRERRGVFPFPPQVRQVPLMLPVQVGRAKRPVTDFGLARMLYRTLEPIDDPELHDDITFEYLGVTEDEIIGRPVHHLAIHRPVRSGWVHAKQDLYIDAETTLPAGTDLWLESGDLDGRYRYTDIDLDPTFDAQTFRLDEGHPEAKPAG